MSLKISYFRTVTRVSDIIGVQFVYKTLTARDIRDRGKEDQFNYADDFLFILYIYQGYHFFVIFKSNIYVNYIVVFYTLI